MKLRTQILLFLLVFGLVPLLGAVVINLPLVLDSLALFYHKAHLQNLRADFRDLDQHLASRQEMIRLLAKLPEPGSILGETEETKRIDLARARYTEWVNQILQDQFDINLIQFFNREGRLRFWLEREIDSGLWRPTTVVPDLLDEEFRFAATRMEPGGVLVSRIKINRDAEIDDPRRQMTLRLISPIASNNAADSTPLGAVVMDIDVGGMARAYRNTLWVHNDGTFLRQGRPKTGQPTAFQTFVGLDGIFAKGKLDLWEGPEGERMIWVPLFLTEDSGHLWVGRYVDPSPLAAFRNALTLRVLSIILLLIVVVVIVARWIAVMIERFGRELTRGIRQVLEEEEPPSFTWRGPKEVKELGHNLNQLARTHAQHNQALRQHARQLEESNRYKSEFLANISHELRTPLNSILLLSKLLSESGQGLSPDQIKQAQVIHDAGRDLRSLIDNILDLSKIEAGQAGITLEKTNLPEVIKDVMDLVRPLFDDKGLYLRLEVSPDAPHQVVTDSDKLRQIIKNFLSNAVKFTHHGGVDVAIGLDADTTSRQPVRIIVRDSGIGIATDKQPVIFEAFQQADGSISRSYGGTGLGLTISRELASLIGGRIELTSTPGEGSVFSLLLPLEFYEQGDQLLPDTPSNNERNKSPASEAIPEADFGGRCVLLVDDDMKSLLALTPLLEGWGLHVTAAGDGEEALDTLAEEGECGLILMDMMMPVMDGYDTIRKIRNDQRFTKLPIVALTVKSGDAERELCLQAGADDFLNKPVNPVELKEVIERLLD